MKKSQFYLLFSVFLAFTLMFLLAKNWYYNDDLKSIEIFNNYFVTELSYLTTLNCSFGLNTIKDFLNRTGMKVELYYYWDNCQNKVVVLNRLKDNLIVNGSKACFSGMCKKIIDLGKHFCLVYSINDKVFFECW